MKQDSWMAVASVGPYAHYLHVTSETDNYAITLFYFKVFTGWMLFLIALQQWQGTH